MIETIGRWELVIGEDEGLLVWGEREREKRDAICLRIRICVGAFVGTVPK